MFPLPDSDLAGSPYQELRVESQNFTVDLSTVRIPDTFMNLLNIWEKSPAWTEAHKIQTFFESMSNNCSFHFDPFEATRHFLSFWYPNPKQLHFRRIAMTSCGWTETKEIINSGDESLTAIVQDRLIQEAKTVVWSQPHIREHASYPESTKEFYNIPGDLFR